MDGVIKLISTGPVQRPDGTWDSAPTAREVFCKVQTVSGREFFNGVRSGINPVFRFDVFAAEYQGETLVEYNGETYSIYRHVQNNANTYVSPNLRERQELAMDYVQLYAERRGGSVGVLDRTAQGESDSP